MIENFKLKVIRVVADNLNYRRLRRASYYPASGYSPDQVPGREP